MNFTKYLEDLYFKSNGKLAKSIISTTAKFAKSVDAKSPTLLLIAGVAGVIGGTYMIVKESKNDEIDAEIEKYDSIIESIKEVKEDIKNGNIPETTKDDGTPFTVKDCNFDLALIRARKGICYTRKYWKGASVELAGIASVVMAFSKEHGRSKANYANYLGMAAVYDNYRKKIIAAIGEEAEEKIRFGLHQEDIFDPVLDKDGNPKTDKDGNPKLKKKTVNVVDAPVDPLDDVNSFLYAPESSGVFDTSSDPVAQWEANMTMLSIIRQSAEDLMSMRIQMYGIENAYVTVNEVLEKFAPRRLPALGNVITWNPNSPDYRGISFGIDNFADPKMKERRMAFLRGEEEAILLTFNHTGTDCRLCVA